MNASPARYRNAIVPHIYIDGAAKAIAFYEKAFGAEEIFRIPDKSGRIVHVEISICGCVIMIGDPGNPRIYGDPRRLGALRLGPRSVRPRLGSPLMGRGHRPGGN